MERCGFRFRQRRTIRDLVGIAPGAGPRRRGRDEERRMDDGGAREFLSFDKDFDGQGIDRIGGPPPRRR